MRFRNDVSPFPRPIMISYQIQEIDKKNGKTRKIYIPSENDADKLRALVPSLENIYKSHSGASANHVFAFIKKRNCSLMASKHVNFHFTLSMDIESFFDSITRHHLSDFVEDSVLDYCLIEGAPRQGLATSPILSNIAFIPIDKLIINTLKRQGIVAVYTRYADDLVFSFNDKSLAETLSSQIALIMRVYGFDLNHKKTKLQAASNGRRIITGIGVDEHGIHPTRKTLRKLRAANHQMNVSSLRGLRQWASCRLPRQL